VAVVFELYFTDMAQEHYDGLAPQKLAKVKKALRFLKVNPRHPGLNTHVYHGIENPVDASAPVFEAYVENNTPGAYRLFWVFGPQRSQITVLAITPHP